MNRTLPLLLLAIAAGCANAPDELSAYPDLKLAMRDFQQEQKRFTAATVVPQVFDFPGQGRVTARVVALEGYPGNTYVKCRFHYENTTGRPVSWATVGLDVLDAEGQVVASQSRVCIFPTPRAIYDGTFYADELRTPTYDVQKQPGWSWRVTCRTQFEPEPTNDGR